MINESHRIYSFLDYRQYLKAYYDYSKDHDPAFSCRAFSRQVGVKAPNFLQWLIEGKRNLAKKTLVKVASAMQLGPKEEEYFTTLVHFNQAKTINEKTCFFEKLIELHPQNSLLLLEHRGIVLIFYSLPPYSHLILK